MRVAVAAMIGLGQAMSASVARLEKFKNCYGIKELSSCMEVYPIIEYIPDVGLKWSGAPWKRILVTYEFQDCAFMGVIEQMFYLQKLDLVVELDSTYYARWPWSYIWKVITGLEHCLMRFLRFLKHWGFIRGTEEGHAYNALQRLEYINLAFWRGRGWQKLFRKGIYK